MSPYCNTYKYKFSGFYNSQYSLLSIHSLLLRNKALALWVWVGDTYLQLKLAQETYRRLSEKGRLLTGPPANNNIDSRQRMSDVLFHYLNFICNAHDYHKQ